MHLRAAEFLLGRDLAGRRLEQRRPGQKSPGAAAHHHDIVGEARLIGAARRGRPVRDGQHRQPCRRHAGEIAECGAAADEILDAITQEVRACAFDELNERQIVLDRDLLHAQDLVEAHRLQRARVDPGVAGADHATDARDKADASDHAAARHAPVRIGIVEHIAREGGEFEERRIRVEQEGHALARQQLAALVKSLLRPGRRILRALFKQPHTVDEREHARAIRLEPLARRRDAAFQDCHGLESVLVSGALPRKMVETVSSA